MIALRSVLFNLSFYAAIIVEMIVFTPYYFLASRRAAWFVPKFWARSNLWLQKAIVGTDHEIEGLENFPAGSFIIAPKHQSFWDTFAFLPHIPDTLYILKRELMWIPLFGWYVAKQKMVPVNRGSRASVLKEVVRVTRERMAEGRQLIIYPEGTRRAPGAPPSYKWGIAELYDQLQLPVVPIAHQAGLYWPRRKFLRFPGTIRAKILAPIPPGLSKEEFHARLVAETEAACDALLVDAVERDRPPLPETARQRLVELGRADLAS